MRDYSKILPAFWIGQSGKKLRGDMEAQLLALYLMTSPHANMIGVYHCPILYMAHETGMPPEGATKALQRLCEAGFCHYEAESDTVFIYRMAAYQIDERLKPNDNRVKGIVKDWQNIASDDIRHRFYATYSEAFCLPKPEEKQSPFEAPCKPLRSQEQEQEQDKEEANASSSPADAADSTMWDCPHGKLLDLWAEHCPTLTQPKRSLWQTSKGAKALRARWRWVLTATEDGKRQATTEDEALAWFAKFFAYIATCPLLIGEGSRGWQADLAWAMKAENFAKVMQGNYHRRQAVAA